MKVVLLLKRNLTNKMIDMKKEDIEKASTLAIRDHYNCNGKYPCSERYYCQYNNGKNTAYDCNECGADEFHEGFLIAAEWRINSVWHKDIQNGKAKKPILVKFDNGLFNLFEDIRDLKGIEDKVSIFAYIEDLLPNKEE